MFHGFNMRLQLLIIAHRRRPLSAVAIEFWNFVASNRYSKMEKYHKCGFVQLRLPSWNSVTNAICMIYKRATYTHSVSRNLNLGFN